MIKQSSQLLSNVKINKFLQDLQISMEKTLKKIE